MRLVKLGQDDQQQDLPNVMVFQWLLCPYEISIPLWSVLWLEITARHIYQSNIIVDATLNFWLLLLFVDKWKGFQPNKRIDWILFLSRQQVAVEVHSFGVLPPALVVRHLLSVNVWMKLRSTALPNPHDKVIRLWCGQIAHSQSYTIDRNMYDERTQFKRKINSFELPPVTISRARIFHGTKKKKTISTCQWRRRRDGVIRNTKIFLSLRI